MLCFPKTAAFYLKLGYKMLPTMCHNSEQAFTLVNNRWNLTIHLTSVVKNIVLKSAHSYTLLFYCCCSGTVEFYSGKSIHHSELLTNNVVSH